MITARKLRPLTILGVFLLVGACATAAKILYPVNDDPLKIKEGVYQLDPTHANVILSVNHLGFSFHHGRFNKMEGSLELNIEEPEKSRAYIKIYADSIDTNSTALDEKLRAETMLNSVNHPYIVFESQRISLNGEKSATIAGHLTMAGARQPFELEATFIGNGTNPLNGLQTIGFSGTGSLIRSEYGMKEWLPFIGDTVTFTIEAEFTRSK